MSGFTSILKNIGIAVAQAGLSYVGLSDLSQRIFRTSTAPPAGVVPSKLEDFYDAIKRAEFISATLKDVTLTGEQKRSLVVPAVTAAFLDIEDFQGKDPKDVVAFQENIDKIVEGIVGAANQFEK